MCEYSTFKEAPKALVMCKYSAFKGPPIATVMYKCLAFKGAPNSSCKTREVGNDASLLSLNFYVWLVLYTQLSVFLKLCILNTHAICNLLCQSCRSFRNVSLGGLHIPFLGLIKRFLSWFPEYDDVVRGHPFSTLPHTP